LLCSEKSLDNDDNKLTTVRDQPDETSHDVTSETITTGISREGNNEIVRYR